MQTDHLDSACCQSNRKAIERLVLGLTVLLVVAAHLFLGLLAEGLLLGWPQVPKRQPPLQARLVLPPTPQPTPQPTPSINPTPTQSATKPERPEPKALVLPDTLVSEAPKMRNEAFSSESLPGLSRAEELRLDRPADLMPGQGVIPLKAYWGRYDQGGQLLGEGEIVLDYPTPAQYRVSLSAKALGWLAVLVPGGVSIKSEGILTPKGLSPLQFEQITPRRGRLESRFDPAARQAVLRPNQDPLSVPEGLQDRLSVVFQLAWMGESQPGGLRPGQRFDLPLATLSEVRALTFHVSDPEDLVLPGGILVPALRVVSDPIQFRRVGQIQIWLDQVDRHMPARILYTEPDGRALDFLVVRATR